MSSKRTRWVVQYGSLLLLGNVFPMLAQWIISNNRDAATSPWNRGWLAHASVTFVVLLAACINWYRKTERQSMQEKQ
jgi:hypothetical protein